VVEGREGGSIYTEQEDGTDCPRGSVLAWGPPHRFVMAWQVTFGSSLRLGEDPGLKPVVF